MIKGLSTSSTRTPTSTQLKIPTENLHAAHTLDFADYFYCFSCHLQGGKNPEGPPDGWAPDLGMARERFNPNGLSSGSTTRRSSARRQDAVVLPMLARTSWAATKTGRLKPCAIT